MYILIPMSEADEEAKIALIPDAKSWALVNVENTKVADIKFYENRDDIQEFIEAVVVKSKNDYLTPFFEESLPVLEAPMQLYIEDIVEAYMFRELFEVEVRF